MFNKQLDNTQVKKSEKETKIWLENGQTFKQCFIWYQRTKQTFQPGLGLKALATIQLAFP